LHFGNLPLATRFKTQEERQKAWFNALRIPVGA
jgi:hypothetical protein